MTGMVTPTQHADMTAMLQGTADAVLSDPATLAVYLDPGFRVRRHLARISRALTRVAEGHTKRLLLMLPPQSGKSTLAAVWLPFWWLARNPAQRVIIGSYGQTLALKRGREIRRLVERHGWKWGLELEWGAKVVTDWSLTAGGGIKSVGVGSGVTGFPADCVVGSTRINTPLGPMRIDDYTDLAAPPKVLSWNHSRSRAEWSRVLATRVISNRRILEVHTRSGKTIRCTPDHRIHTPDGGYRPAADLRPGDQISALVGQPALPGVQIDLLPCAPHQRGREGQPAREPDHPVRDVPLSAPPLGNDTISLVRDLRDESEPVYDLQVEGNSNFFADEVLVHNCAIIDDPHKSRAEADSRTMRDGVWDWYSSDFLTRLAPGGPVVAMLTPWHEDDWSHRVLERDGRVEEGGEWEVVRIPALADSDDDPLGRAPGEPLPHPMLEESDTDAALAHWNERRRQVTARDWGALYQLDPKPSEGALVDRDMLRRQRHTPPPADPVKAAVAVDPSGGGRDTAGIIGGYLGDDGRLYITDDATMIGSSDTWARSACEMAAALGAEVIVVEKNYGGDMARNVIRSAWDHLARTRDDDERFQRLAPQVKMVSAKKGKLLRAEPVAQQLIEDRVRLGANLPELEEEWASWQPTDPDSPGRIDASCYLVYAVLPVPGAEALISSPAGVPRSRTARSGAARIQRRRT